MDDNERKQKLLWLRQELLAAESERAAGRMGCTIDELDKYLDRIIETAENEK